MPIKTQCCLLPFSTTDFTPLATRQEIGWHISALNLRAAWELSRGEGVVVAVLDTGCDLDHPDLCENLLPGRNCIDNKQPPEDDNDHGTHVAGIICARDNEFGVIGVAPEAKVMPMKVLDMFGMGDVENIICGIYHAIDRGADILSLSFGCPRPVPDLRTAIRYAARKGIPTFCAGGNVSKHDDALYPARYVDTIAIAACDQRLGRAEFSNTLRNNLDFLMPGTDILSAVRGGYATMTGSSTAQPIAAGCAALLLAARRKRNLPLALKTVEDYREAFRKHMGPMGLMDPYRLLEAQLTSSPRSTENGPNR